MYREAIMDGFSIFHVCIYLLVGGYHLILIHLPVAAFTYLAVEITRNRAYSAAKDFTDKIISIESTLSKKSALFNSEICLFWGIYLQYISFFWLGLIIYFYLIVLIVFDIDYAAGWILMR